MKAWGDQPKKRRDDPEIQRLRGPRRQPDAGSPVEPSYDSGPPRGGRPGRPEPAGPTLHESPCGLGASAPDPRLPAIPRAHAALDTLGQQLGEAELRDPIVAAAALDALRRGVHVDTPLLLAVLDGREFPWEWPSDGGPGSSLYRRCDGADVYWRPREASSGARIRRPTPGAWWSRSPRSRRWSSLPPSSRRAGRQVRPQPPSC